LVRSVCCPGGFLYLKGKTLSMFGKCSEYIIYPFGLLMELLNSYIFLSQLLSCLTKISSVFALISILSLSSEILSSTCSSLLEWLSTVFCIVGTVG
jgi:hypothetical protein